MCDFTGIIHHYPATLNEEEGGREELYRDNYMSLRVNQPEVMETPLHYNDDALCFVVCGKIYNTTELRAGLTAEGYTFETTSDVEILATLFKKHQEKAFALLRGMFAVLVWDKKRAVLYGARDPFGIKPLFYCETEAATVFASDKKAISYSTKNEDVNSEALQHYFSFQFVPEPMTMTSHIQKILPGHYFMKRPGEDLTLHRYWHATFTPVLMAEQDWIKRIRDVLYDSVEAHMQDDVSIGSFLSGGIDSTVLTAIAKDIKPDIQTFSADFEREGYSEMETVEETVAKLGVDNTAYHVTPEEFVTELPQIMWHMGDPLADPACVPLYFAAKKASQHVNIVLSGEGADELFGGYNIYREPESLKLFNYMPSAFKDVLRSVASVMPEGLRGKSFLERGTTPLRERYIGNAKIFEEEEKQQFLTSYRNNLSYQHVTKPLYDYAADEPLVNQMQYIDMHTWLPGDILLSAERMTKAHGLDLRVPFLDKAVFQVASELPPDLKIAKGTTKHMLRQAARGIIPDHVLDRKKLGFPVPIRHWLKNELYDWAKKLIQESSTDHLLHKSYVAELLEAHCQDKGDYSRKIWTALMFMLWHQLFVEKSFDTNTFPDDVQMPMS